MDNAHCTDIRDMLDIVAKTLRSLQTDQGQKQSSSYEVRHFHKKLFLNPGLDNSMNLKSPLDRVPEDDVLHSSQLPNSPLWSEAIRAAKRDSIDNVLETLGFDMNEQLFKASENGEVDKVRLFLDYSGLNINKGVTEEGVNALLVASKNGHVNVVELLLARPEIDSNITTEDESTALHMASRNGHLGVVELLLGHKRINVNSVTAYHGSSPLWLASSEGHAEVAERLLGHPEIDVNQGTSLEGTTPLYVASYKARLVSTQRKDPI